MKRIPVVAIVGKPNAGKSALFNRIVKRRRAITHATPGVTRDIVEERVTWGGVEFSLMDTGGYLAGTKDRLTADIADRVRRTARDAAVIVFLADIDTGSTSEDMALLRVLAPYRDKIVLAVNKVENEADRWSVHEFHSLGLGEIHAISSLHGEGIGDLLDEVVSRLPKKPLVDVVEPLTIAIVGKPNVGKSSLVNALVGEERNIVSETPGTTRDSVNVHVRREGREFVLVDTAGVKRRARTTKGLDSVTSFRSLSSARNAEIVLVMIDASLPISRQDVRVASEGHRARKGMIILINKWDLVEKDSGTVDRYIESVRSEMAFLSYAPILTISALKGLRVEKILPLAVKVEEAREKKITTSVLNKIIENLMEKNPPSFHAGGSGKIYYATQTGIKPPTFTLFVNRASYFPRSYTRYVNNQIRKLFTFEGTTITISLRSKER